MRAEKKEINIAIGQRLQTIRKNGAYTQEAFAELLDVGVEHYRKIENGIYGLQPEKMLLLYEKFKVDPTYLVTGEKKQELDIDWYLTNCSRTERNRLLDRLLCYIKQWMLKD